MATLTFLISLYLHLWLLIFSFYRFADYYTPGNPVTPPHPYEDALPTIGGVYFIIQILILIPVSIYMSHKGYEKWLKKLGLINLLLAGVFLVLLVIPSS
ncbi:MAG: hypothetical protein F6K16_36470 [Symploca sp. SIO2B6]|nr:hypothetical protein [Symploca sp. SIO2B6]